MILCHYYFFQNTSIEMTKATTYVRLIDTIRDAIIIQIILFYMIGSTWSYIVITREAPWAP